MPHSRRSIRINSPRKQPSRRFTRSRHSWNPEPDLRRGGGHRAGRPFCDRLRAAGPVSHAMCHPRQGLLPAGVEIERYISQSDSPERHRGLARHRGGRSGRQPHQPFLASGRLRRGGHFLRDLRLPDRDAPARGHGCRAILVPEVLRESGAACYPRSSWSWRRYGASGG